MNIGPLRPSNGWEKPFQPEESGKRDLYDLDCEIQEIPQGLKDRQQAGVHSGEVACWHSNTCTCNNGHGC